MENSIPVHFSGMDLVQPKNFLFKFNRNRNIDTCMDNIYSCMYSKYMRILYNIHIYLHVYAYVDIYVCVP